MSNLDIVARLQLRGEQFSSETGARFAEMKTRAASAAADVRSSFSSSFAEVQKMAAGALAMPRSSAGSLDLSSEIKQLQAGAAASDRHAQAMRELSIAQTAAASAGRGDVEALKLEADASAVAALASERDAEAKRLRITTLQAVQTELNRSKSLTLQDAQAMDQVAEHTGRASIAKMELMHVIRASSDSFAAGAPLSQIFGTEIGRIAEVLQLYGMEAGRATEKTEATGGSFVETGSKALEFGKNAAEAGEKMKGAKGAAVLFGEALSGPVGIAVVAALAVLSPYALKLLQTNTALDDAVDKLKADAVQSDVTREAKERFARSIEGVTNAIHEQLEAQNKAIEAERTAAENANINARAQLALEIATRKATAAQLAQALVQANTDRQAAAAEQQHGTHDGATFASSVLDARVAALQADLAKVDAAVAAAQQLYNNSRVDLASEQGKRDADAAASATKKYEDLERAARNAARGNAALTASLSGVIAGLEKQKQAELDAIRAAERTHKPKVVSLGDQLEAEQGQRLLTSAQSYAGLDENRDKSALERLFAQAHENVDPSKVAWCAAFVNAVLATNGLPGTGSLSARSFLGYGEKTDKPEKGDIVVARRGTGDQGHVGFFDGLDAKGNIRVLGGNTSNKVGVETVNRSDVLGFRRAPSASDSYKADEEAAKKNAEMLRQTSDEIARINAQWDEQPRLVDRAGLETHKLDEIIADLTARKPPGFEQLIADAQHAKQTIQDGINRPFDQFVKAQHESLAVQGLVLRGREVEANALQTALRLQQQMGPLSDAQLATILKLEQAQQHIADALEDQRRVIGLYTGAVGDLEQSVNTFLNDLRTKPGSAVKDLVNGFYSAFRKLQSALTTEQLFGGMQRDIERYVAQKMGGSTPADMLKEQLGNAGTALVAHVDKTGSALDDFVGAVRAATAQLGGIGPAVPIVGPTASADLMSTKGFEAMTEQIRFAANGLDREPANDNDVVVVAQRAQTAAIEKNTTAHITSADLFNKIGGDLVTHLETMVGVKLPAALEQKISKGLGTVLQGASLGQLGGSVFSSITGGKQSALGEAAGGALGKIAGDALGKTIGGTIGKALGPLGSVVGGILGDVVGGLFRSTPKASAGISVSNGAITATKASGNDASATSQASSLAGSVAQGLSQIADQLGAAITGTTDVKIGTYNGQWRVNDHGGAIGGVKGSGAISFDTEQEAISYAISDALKDGVLSGISAASEKILQSGQDLSTAINKALMIEQIPKDLKAMIDPVGAAIDTLNTKWNKTVAALKEGGATAEQMAQAQQLYNLQLAQVKNSTDAADKTLQDFKTSLMLGSSSAYSLRDQETTAKAALQPYLDQINAGQAIDQSKYQTAAQAFLDVERQLYGSTKAYFDALDTVQASTNKAIATVDNATPITTAVESPFASATATSTAATADNTGTANDLLSQASDQLSTISSQLTQLLAQTSGGGASGFIGSGRNYVQAI